MGRSRLRVQSLLRLGSGVPAVGIVCFVVHHQPVIHEVEAVRLCLVRVTDHLADQLFRERGEVVDVLAGVLAAGDAEAEVEVKAFEQLVAEVVPLDHAEVVDGLLSHRELHRGSHLPQAEKGRGELVADKAPSIGVQIPPVDGQPL